MASGSTGLLDFLLYSVQSSIDRREKIKKWNTEKMNKKNKKKRKKQKIKHESVYMGLRE